MTLVELIQAHGVKPAQSVPEWMLGCFRRRCISFANGECDSRTIVYWFQSRNFTIDLRLPIAGQQVPARRWQDYSVDEQQVLARYEGWAAHCQWDGERLSWSGETAMQLHNPWPEPALLKRIGNCMIEFAPSGAYVEDWRLQPSAPGALAGLRLLEERDLGTGQVTRRGGGLIVCGDHAALVLGRQEPVGANGKTLPKAVALADSTESLCALLDFETSVATADDAGDYRVAHSTRAHRVGQPLMALQDFEFREDTGQVCHRFSEHGRSYERLFEVDVLESNVEFPLSTETTPEAEDWFERESNTLKRYTQLHL